MLRLGNVSEFLNIDLFYKVDKISKDIYKNNPRNRSLSQIFEHTLQGELGEKAFTKYFGFEQVDYFLYDVLDPKTNTKYEIKTTKNNAEYWVFSEKSYMYFKNNAYNIDYICLLYIDKKGEIYLKYKVPANKFFKYVSKSKFNSNMYFNHKLAYRNKNIEIY